MCKLRLPSWKAFGAFVALSVCLGACVPMVKAPEWMVPVTLDGERYYVPIPQGFVEQCSDAPPLRASVGDSEHGSSIVACLAGIDEGSAWNEGSVSVVPAGEAGEAHFDAFKSEVERRLKASNASTGIALSHAGRVLRQLSKGEAWVVYAAARQADEPSASGAVQPGSLTVVLAHQHIFYLALWNRSSTVVADWKTVAMDGQSWAQSLIRANLWR